MKKVAGYVRVSSVGGRSGESFYSPGDQEREIRRYCSTHGLEVAELVVELDESGSKLARSKLQEIVRKIEAGELAAIVVARLDRLSRLAAKDRVTLIDAIDEAGGDIFSASEAFDKTTPEGRFAREVFLGIARMQWEQRAEGFDGAKRNAVARGVHISGKVPVGYLRNGRGARLERDPRTAPAIRSAFALFASGSSFADVVRMLDRKLPGGPSGEGVWNRNTVTRLLRNEVYVGTAFQGDYRQENAHPEIVDRETFVTVQALLRRGEPPASTATVSLLAGVARCGSCGYALDRNTVGGGYVVYRCRGRSASGVCAAPVSAMLPAVDELVETAVLESLSAHAVERVPATTDRDAVHVRLAAVRVKREPFEDPEYVALLGKAEAMRALRKLNEEIAVIEGELADAVVATHDDSPFTQGVADIWPTLTLAERRQVIAAMVDTILISRAPRGTALADRVNIYWMGDDVPLARPSRGRGRGNGAEVETAVAAA